MKPSTYFKVTYLLDGKQWVSAVQARDLTSFVFSHNVLKVERG